VFTLGIIAKHEYSIANGTTARFETLPVDPRDIIRGDYLALRFKIAQDAINAPKKTENGSVYITYTIDENNYAQFKDISNTKPTDQPFIIGKKNWNRITLNAEKFFVPEGKGLSIERMENITLEAVIASNGTVYPQILLQNDTPIDMKLIKALPKNSIF
jgi:uncharacterized membrane-anchored protein